MSRPEFPRRVLEALRQSVENPRRGPLRRPASSTAHRLLRIGTGPLNQPASPCEHVEIQQRAC